MAGIAKQILVLQRQLTALKDAYAAEFEDTVKDKTPVDWEGDHPGQLRDGWKADVTSTKITIENPVPYASFVEYGVPPHTRTSAWGRPTQPYTHPGQAAAGMLRLTKLEHDRIMQVAKKKVGLK